MTMPTGLLAWGQAGSYDAIVDRGVITALAQGRPSGLISPPTLVAQAGLAIQVGAWSALVDCGDGTRAVAATRSAQTFSETAGGSSARTDVLFADLNVDGGSWTANLYASGAEAGRTGVTLGTILVPANASTASAMTLTPAAAMLPAQGVISYQREIDTNHSRTPNQFSTAHKFCTSPSLALQAGRLYRLLFQTNATSMNTSQGSSDQAMTMQFDMDSSAFGPTHLQRYPPNTQGLSQAMHAEWPFVLSAPGTHTFAVRVWANQGPFDVDRNEVGVWMTITDHGPLQAGWSTT